MKADGRANCIGDCTALWMWIANGQYSLMSLTWQSWKVISALPDYISGQVQPTSEIITAKIEIITRNIEKMSFETMAFLHFKAISYIFIGDSI